MLLFNNHCIVLICASICLRQVAWYKDGDRIPDDDDRIKTTLLPDGTVKLNIDSVTPADSGAYKLVVKNPNGETVGLCAVAVNRKCGKYKICYFGNYCCEQYSTNIDTMFTSSCQSPFLSVWNCAF